MERVSAERFREQLEAFVDRAIERHEPLYVTRPEGGDFVVLSLEDFDAEQETLGVLADDRLMAQIRQSSETRLTGRGRVVCDDRL